MFFGVIYHLRNPLLALEKILSVCTGTPLMQSYSLKETDPEVDRISQVSKLALAKFYPSGIQSGPNRSYGTRPSFGYLTANAPRTCYRRQGFEKSRSSVLRLLFSGPNLRPERQASDRILTRRRGRKTRRPPRGGGNRYGCGPADVGPSRRL
jgi:hypothetical protein